MNIIADVCVTPLGVGVSTSPYVTACVKILKRAGLRPRLHAYGTNVEGRWDEVFDAIRECHRVVHEMGAPRISTTIRFGTRTDRPETIDGKIQSVEEKLISRRVPRTPAPRRRSTRKRRR